MSDEHIERWIEVASAAVRAHWEADEAASEDLGDREQARRDAVERLRRLSDAELETHILPLSEDGRIERRVLVPEVLRFVRANDHDWAERRARYATTLLALARRETDPNVLCAYVAGFLDLEDPRCLDFVIAHAVHLDPTVRQTVAGVLASHPECSRALVTLLALSVDPEDEVRNWATFGLAQSRLDAAHPSAEAVREALHARIEDPHEECRGEAWTGLAIARDPRVVPLIHDALAGRRQCWLVLEAIEEWPRREYLKGLARPVDRWSEASLARVRAACEGATE